MEKWREVYTEDQIKHVQAIELKNLTVLEDVCSKIGIEFFVYGGTLIGAVRHKGFIPWDDDLDVAMLREDYEKFIAEADQYLPSEYVLQTPYHNRETPYPYTKLRLKGTKYVEYGYHKLNMEQGIYVDIYPIDHLPDDERLYRKQFKKYQFYSRLYAWRQCPYLDDQSKTVRITIKRWLKFVGSFALKLLSQKYLVKRIDQIATKYNQTETKRRGNLNFPKPTNYFYEIQPFEKGVFEGYPVWLPRNWDLHLTSRYGDYMQLPSENERIGHKPYLLNFGNY